MKTTESSPAEAPRRREIQEVQASRLLSTPDRGASPQPSVENPHSKAPRCEDKNWETPLQLDPRKYKLHPTLSTPRSPHSRFFPLPIRSHTSPFAVQRFRLRLRASAPPREFLLRLPPSALRSPSPAFSLVELLVVMAIVGLMVGLSAMAVQGMRAPAVQHAADQVMSGLSLARQIAITKNTQAALLIATNTNSGFPAEPYRYWSVVYSNRGNSTWTLAKDWEALPNGAFFLDTRGQSGASYSPIGGNPLANDYSLGEFQPTKFATATFTVNGTSISSAVIPAIQFTSDGAKSSGGAEAIRIAQGSVLGGNATLTSLNQYYVIETDVRTGRIRMRSPQSYRSP